MKNLMCVGSAGGHSHNRGLSIGTKSFDTQVLSVKQYPKKRDHYLRATLMNAFSQLRNLIQWHGTKKRTNGQKKYDHYSLVTSINALTQLGVLTTWIYMRKGTEAKKRFHVVRARTGLSRKAT